jgi:glucose-6-phosphate isomerase
MTHPLTTGAAWSALTQYGQSAAADLNLSDLFAAQPNRFADHCLQAAGITVDLSKNLTNPSVDALLTDLANATGVLAQREALFAGEPINNTEQRAVMHWLLRSPKGAPQANSQLAAAHQQVHQTLDAMLAFAEQVRANTGITDVVNIGIGGSDLGPQMAVLALQDHKLAGKRFHFVSNVDGHEMAATLNGLRPESTLFLVASKTFTTAETMLNAHTAKTWFLAQGGTHTQGHFVGLTTNVAAAAQFGIAHTFGFWDWVGGRYSIWSSIGLSLAIAIGAKGFTDLLAGAHAMDEHFRITPLAHNLPARLALLDVWYRNGLGYTSRCVAPYHSALRRLPAYLQQLEMESNGKRVDRHGATLAIATSPVVWGEPGTNGQHAFFQMLHQSNDVIPVEFIGVQKASHHLPGHHTQLLANLLAQSQALMQGKADAGGHRHFTGNRPSTIIMLDALTPERLGALIALYEHRVFVAGALWGINSFDQWGVELAKVLASQVQQALQTGQTAGLDASTAGWVRVLGGFSPSSDLGKNV